MKLIDILEEIDAYLMDNEESYYSYKDFNLEHIIFSEEPQNNTRKDWNEAPIYFNEKWTGEEEINSNIILYSHCGHNGDSFICSYEKIEDLEKSILGPAGIKNIFSTHEIPIINGKFKNYEVYTIIDNVEIIFDKEIHGSSLDKNIFDNNPDIRLRWL